jgi:hypothetical protein
VEEAKMHLSGGRREKNDGENERSREWEGDINEGKKKREFYFFKIT